MLPRMCFNFEKLLGRKRKDDDCEVVAMDSVGWDWGGRHSVVCRRKATANPAARAGLRSERKGRNEEIKERKMEMTNNKVSNISHLIHRVASSCLTHHPSSPSSAGPDDEDTWPSLDNEEEGGNLSIWEEQHSPAALQTVRQMESLMAEVFDVVSAVKRAYFNLQEAHSPWDPDRIRAADAAVVAEIRRLGRLRDRFRRGAAGRSATAPLREAVAPYEAALHELSRDLKAKEAEVESLKEKLRSATTPRSAGGNKGRHYGKKVGCVIGLAPATAPTAELFEACMEQVSAASKSFTAHLLSLMRAARWDIAAAVRSIVEGDGGGGAAGERPAAAMAGAVEPGHARHALESYVCRRMFQGFENETFYMEGSLTSLLRPEEFRQGCFAQFRDMRGMDPAELLGVLPTCQFGRFAGKKYLAVMHPRMEESLFGGAEQRRQVVAGGHPRTGFYGEFLSVAKAVWLLHLLAFALDPAPSHFEAGKGAEFHPEYMESVVRLAGGGRPPAGWVVGFSVCPGFRLGNGSVVRARVYLVPRSSAGM